MKVFWIYARTEMMQWLHEVPARSLVLAGEKDGGCDPRLNRFIDDALPISELVKPPASKHAILLVAGQEVAAHLIRFLLGGKPLT